MLKKHIFCLLIAAACLAGCNENTDAAETSMTTLNVNTETMATVSSVTQTSATEKVTTTAETSATTTETTLSHTDYIASVVEKIEKYLSEYEYLPVSELMNKDGTVNEKGLKQIYIIALSAEGHAMFYSPEVGLYDFDGDNVPEVYVVQHNGGQGTMKTWLFTLGGEYKGEFLGYCRDGSTYFSRDKDGVYVHNYYEHSNWQRVEFTEKFTHDGEKAENCRIFWIYGTQAGEPFNFWYYVNEEETDKKTYYEKYGEFLNEGGEQTREANEISMCSFDTKFLADENFDRLLNDTFSEDKRHFENAFTAVRMYNTHINFKNRIKSEFGTEPQVFAFRDYEKNGNFGAFVLLPPEHGDTLYYIDDERITAVAENCPRGIAKEVYGVCSFQSADNSSPARIFGVADRKPYETVFSNCGYNLRASSLENGELELYDVYVDEKTGERSFIPYYFWYENIHTELAFRTYENRRPPFEIGAVLISKEQLKSKLEDVPILDDIQASGGEITQIFERSDMVNINYRIDGGEYYKTVYLGFVDYVPKIIDEGKGSYKAALIPEIAKYIE